MGNFLRDLKLSSRTLAKAPAFTITALLTLALCIGANTAIFSVIDSVLLRALPYPNPQQLATVETRFRGHEQQDLDDSQDGDTWFLVKQHASDVQAAAYGLPSGVNFAIGNHPEYVQQQRVSAGFFNVLGVSPLFGRAFTEDEDLPKGPNVAVLSYDFWKRTFAADPAVVGRSIMLKGTPHTVIGVMPKGFRSEIDYGGAVYTKADVWTPLHPNREGEGQGTNYGIIARLNLGVTWPQADGQIAVVGAAHFSKMHLPPGVSAQLTLVPMQQGLTSGIRTPLLMLWVSVGLVLLIGCLNVSGLLLARSQARTRELATRLSLGASRFDVIRQLFAESFVLAFIGAALGVALAWVGLRSLAQLMEDGFGLTQSGAVDARVLAATAILAIIAVFVFGMWPAWQASRTDMRSAIAESSLTVAGARSRWPRRALVLAEVAFGFLLLIGAGLLLRTFVNMRGLEPGMDPHNVTVATFSLQDARYSTAAAMNDLFDRALARLSETPGIESAAVSLSLPYQRPLNVGFAHPGRAMGEWNLTNLTYITPAYFSTLQIPVLRGRAFAPSDSAHSNLVVIVNRAFVDKYYKGQEVIGTNIILGDAAKQIVGVVGNVQEKEDFGSFGGTKTMAMVLVPAAQVADDFMGMHIWFSPSLIVRSRLPRAEVGEAVRGAIATADPLLPVAKLTDMEAVESVAFAGEHAESLLVSLMSVLALVLAAVGIYGLIASSVVERTREMGIRMALGATPMNAIRDISRTGVMLGIAGVAIGCVAALPLVMLIRNLLYGVQPRDPLTFVLAGLVLVVTATAASVIPAARIVRLNPAATLRVS